MGKSGGGCNTISFVLCKTKKKRNKNLIYVKEKLFFYYAQVFSSHTQTHISLHKYPLPTHKIFNFPPTEQMFLKVHQTVVLRTAAGTLLYTYIHTYIHNGLYG